ncbi:hypothetical protein [Prochlorococcus marinus]|uniref:hypothetical protein n=1 Tax=Prochlorococcus marinus TaxID=1219 RepID=UPI001F32DC91|nr:hypothetical protein [Prochlorococcus marinus]
MTSAGCCWVQGMAGVLSLPSGSNNKALRRAPASDVLKSRTGFRRPRTPNTGLSTEIEWGYEQ